MKMYNKPEIYVEEFMPNQVVAACTTEEIGSTTTITPQPVTCGRTGDTQENLFLAKHSCANLPDSYGYYNATQYKNNDGHDYDDFSSADAVYNALDPYLTPEGTGPQGTIEQGYTKGVNGDWSGYLDRSEWRLFDGYYAFWKGDGMGLCFGSISSTILKIFGSSY